MKSLLQLNAWRIASTLSACYLSTAAVDFYESRGLEGMNDFWVFGYGSLMWRPGFPHKESVPSLLYGAHRALCIYSHVHRGTPEQPGLVLGLDRGGACHGLGFRVDGSARDDVLAYLREREQTTMVYRETWRKLKLLDGRKGEVNALCYIADRQHRQYAGRLSIAGQIAFISGSSGQSGPNEDYVLRTVAHLEEMGIRDSGLEALATALRTPIA